MALFTIKEMLEYKRNDPLYSENTFLIQELYNPPTPPEDPEEDPPPDVRPDWVKAYVDTVYNTSFVLDDVIADKFRDWVFCNDCVDVQHAYGQFYKWNAAYLLTHQTELKFVYEAYTKDFDPRENYDRYEETNVNTDMSTGGTSKTAPDDSETFYNVGSADSTTEGDVKTTGHIHGNIGVVDAPTMAKNVINVFGGSGWIEYFVEKLIKENCILVD